MKKPVTLPFSFAQYLMLRSTVGYCTTPENQPVTSLVAGFAQNITIVKNSTDAIEALLGSGTQNITGTAQTKKDLKLALARAMMNVYGPVCAFATATSNKDLLMV